MNAEKRPNPDDLLNAVEAELRQARRGELKIFFGASAGVGKTFAMLQAARSLRAHDVDVVVGVIETHGRPETQALLADLTILPRRTLLHKGVQLEEFDLDLALARKPSLILVDELAHTNAPGSRHPKRWQDVEELLDAGIDVYTTLNVQHLEGFNDVIGNITGIDVQETVPDAIFDEATDVQLVDIPTEELLHRLALGKVYVAEGAAQRAAQNFFNKTNLMSLRELALRRTAEHVDADTDYERIQAGLFTPNIAGDKVLVAIGPDRLAAKLVRTGQRIARSLRAPWYVVSIDSARSDPDDRRRKHIRRALQIAEQNEARITLLQEDRIGDAILDYARSKGITKIIIGRNIRPAWMDWIFGSLVEYVLRHSGDIDVYVVTGYTGDKRRIGRWVEGWGNIKNYAAAFGLTGLCTGVGLLLDPILEPIDIVMIYLIGVVVAASKLGRAPSLVFSFFSVSCFNFFFIEPRHSFTVYDRSYWLTFLVMLATSFVISTQAGRLRQQTLRSRDRERETQTFYALTREMAATRERTAIIKLALKHIGEALSGQTRLWLLQNEGRFDIEGGEISGDRTKEETVAAWSAEHRQAAGRGTDTLPSAAWYYAPLVGTSEVYGAIAYSPAEPDAGTGRDLTIAEKIALETFANLIASSLDRVHASATAEEMRIEREAEALKNMFLSSMSHDLRTPLAAIRGSAETLLEAGSAMPKDTRRTLLHSIHAQADRLTRIMNNLLDLTRFETGRAAIREESYYLKEIIGTALVDLKARLQRHKIEVEVPDHLPMIRVDGLLFEQLLQNLLENAASFSPPGSVIMISAFMTQKGIVLTIADQGSGIADGMERRIFEKFFTMERGDRPKGAGLGLAICQAIVTAHGGHIWAESKKEYKTGATFHVLIPHSRLVLVEAPVEDA
jgi:two-component system sensor histidine kinase KdpD